MASLILLAACISIAFQFPSVAPAFHIPVSVVVICLVWSLFVSVLLLCRWAWKESPLQVRYISLALVAVVLLFIEARAHFSKELHGFFTNDSNSGFVLLPPDSLMDYHTFVADSFGVNHYNVSSHSPHLPRPLNSDGFHSSYEFTQAVIDSAKKRGEPTVFLIGDSYTYGSCADSGKSYAELLDNLPGLQILNAGMSGTDAVQYECVVREYIGAQKLKPALVAVCICGANDITGVTPRIATPGTPLFFDTNGGCMKSEAFDSTHYLKTAREVYSNALALLDYLNFGSGTLARLIDHSPLASACLRLVTAFAVPVVLLFDKTAYLNLTAAICTNAYFGIDHQLRAMQTICAAEGVPLKFLLIPNKRMIEQKHAAQIPGVISLDPKPLSANDYPDWAHDHPNTEGHRKIYEQLRKVLGK